MILKGNIYTPKKIIRNSSIEINDGRISNFNKISQGKSIYLDELNIAYGLIDLQQNGIGKTIFNNDISLKSLYKMSNENLKVGNFCFLPTLVTDDFEKIKLAIEIVKKALEENIPGVLGLHLEGPYISNEKKGIHNLKFIKNKISDSELEYLCKYGKNIIKIITIAPEKIDSGQILKLKKANIKVCAGHSNISYNEGFEKVSKNFDGVTHLYNAMSGFNKREPGLVEIALNSNIYSGIIGDGKHVSYPIIDITYKILKEKMFLVSDSVVTENFDNIHFCGEKIYFDNEKLVDGKGILAGSCITIFESIKKCIKNCSINEVELFNMGNKIPSEFLGINNEVGEIKIGNYANLIVFDNNYDLKYIVKGNELVEI